MFTIYHNYSRIHIFLKHFSGKSSTIKNGHFRDDILTEKREKDIEKGILDIWKRRKIQKKNL